jgi:hypothetical protein
MRAGYNATGRRQRRCFLPVVIATGTAQLILSCLCECIVLRAGVHTTHRGRCLDYLHEPRPAGLACRISVEHREKALTLRAGEMHEANGSKLTIQNFRADAKPRLR